MWNRRVGEEPEERKGILSLHTDGDFGFRSREEALWYGDCAGIEQKAAVLAALTVAMAV